MLDMSKDMCDLGFATSFKNFSMIMQQTWKEIVLYFLNETVKLSKDKTSFKIYEEYFDMNNYWLVLDLLQPYLQSVSGDDAGLTVLS